MSTNAPCHAVAIVGGACAGSTTADILAQNGCHVVVFDQNQRPYGKIEDGLPRWHDKQRVQEYRKIDERLSRSNVSFVPSTKLGKDLDFVDLATNWGFSAVVLANGAWRDRPLDVPNASDWVGKGLLYQNPFIQWFNHKEEKAYNGPRFEVQDSAVCVGGGLASLDVVKVMQLELYQRALARRGITVDAVEMEHEGIPKVCKNHGIDDPATLGVKNATLMYRRRIEDMPLAAAPKGANEKQLAKVEEVRKKILSKSQQNFLFEVRAQTVAKELIIEGGRVRGLVVMDTKVAGKDAVPVPGSEKQLRTDLVVSSIGSIPEPIDGILMKGTFYQFKDWDTGEYGPLPGVYATGNVVTGQGNIKVSADHGKQVAAHLVENVLAPMNVGEQAGAAAAAAVASGLQRKAPLAPAAFGKVLDKVRARQKSVGYEDYPSWIKRVTPADLA
jgi:ferredoxin--NADP+ reductase